MAQLTLDGLVKTYKDGTEAVRGISFDVADKEAVFLLGPSGAGKTTTLRLVAGLEDADDGEIRINGHDHTRSAPRYRNVAMVYDKHSLFPHLSVYENLAYPLRIRKLNADEENKRISSVADVLQIEEQLQKMPGQLSGGQMQRVAIGRALVRDADVFLLDEPISHLDAQLRARMRVEFKRLQRDFNATMLYVSHDQLEAMTMADRVVLINKGRIEQIDRPQDLFDRPRTIFAATFVGEPTMNTMPVNLVVQSGKLWLELGTSLIAAPDEWAAQINGRLGTDDFILGIRPQHLNVDAPDRQGDDFVHGKIFAVETLGSRVIFDIELGGQIVRVMNSVDEARRFPRKIGAPISIRLDPAFFYLFHERDGRTVMQAGFTHNPVGQKRTQ
ncbi:MAG: ABC transporter ATP-binding protein [Rhizobiaceae bacterium]